MKTLIGIFLWVAFSFRALWAQEIPWWNEFRNEFEMKIPAVSTPVHKIPDADSKWRQDLFKKTKVDKRFYKEGGTTKTYIMTGEVCTCRLPVYVNAQNKDQLLALYQPYEGYLIDLKNKTVSGYTPGGGSHWGYKNQYFQTARSVEEMKKRENQKWVQDRKLSGSIPKYEWKEIPYLPGDAVENPKAPGMFYLEISPKLPYPLNSVDRKETGEFQEPEENVFLLTQDYCEMKAPVYVDMDNPKRYLIPTGDLMSLFMVDLDYKDVGWGISKYFHISPDGHMVVSILSKATKKRLGKDADFYSTVGDPNFKFLGSKVMWQDGSRSDD